MNNSILNKLSKKNLKANKEFVLPFIISNSIMFALFFIFTQLIDNNYVKKTIADYNFIGMILKFGAVFIALLAFIFSTYGNRILIKNRFKEFGLYSVLGMEKRHILKLLLKENIIIMLIISVISIVFGFLLGAITFLSFIKLTSHGTFLEFKYGFSVKGAIITLILIAVSFLLNYFFNLIKITRLNPIELFSMGKKNEKEPKSNIILMIIGIGALAYGYYIALTAQGLMKSVLQFFIAVLLVTIGTYLLFMSLSIFILKRLKANKNHYYKTENFINVSNMLYRMKQNSVSLASITILTTSLVVAVGASAFSYFGSESSINNTVPLDANLKYSGIIKDINSKEELDGIFKLNDGYIDIINKEYPIESSYKVLYSITSTGIEKNSDKNITFVQLSNENSKQYGKDPGLFIVYDMDSLNNYRKTNDKIADNEVIVKKDGKYKDLISIKINGKEYKVIKQNDFPPSNVVSDFEPIVFSSPNEFLNVTSYLNKNMSPIKGETSNSISIDSHFKFKEGTNSTGFTGKMSQKLKGEPVELVSRGEIEGLIYSLNGGLLFVGLTVGAVLLIGTVLMMYYKQISEGMDDKENFEIMKKVGLPNELIKKTMRSQLKWIFFLPILVTIIHVCFAHKILYNISSQFGLRDMKTFIMILFGVLLAFIVIYFIVYLLTSKVYYNIINREEVK